jgi:hypothetical protein
MRWIEASPIPVIIVQTLKRLCPKKDVSKGIMAPALKERSRDILREENLRTEKGFPCRAISRPAEDGILQEAWGW